MEKFWFNILINLTMILLVVIFSSQIKNFFGFGKSYYTVQYSNIRKQFSNEIQEKIRLETIQDQHQILDLVQNFEISLEQSLKELSKEYNEPIFADGAINVENNIDVTKHLIEKLNMAGYLNVEKD